MADLDYEQAKNEENILEDAKSLSQFTKVKKKNIIGMIRFYKDSYNVHRILQDSTFKCDVLRSLDFLQYKRGLPIYAKKKEFFDSYQNNNVLIIKSSAGSGKSTQMPQYLLECARGKILVTQPRVIAAESVAKRVQEVY